MLALRVLILYIPKVARMGHHVGVVNIYKRHSADCDHKEDRNYKRCGCAVWLGYTRDGKQVQKSAKTRSWEAGQRAAQALMQQFDGLAPTATAAKTVSQAIDLFLANKRGENLAADSLYRHKHITGDLLAFCNHEGIMFVKDITLHHLTSWRGQWTAQAPQATPLSPGESPEFLQVLSGCGNDRHEPRGTDERHQSSKMIRTPSAFSSRKNTIRSSQQRAKRR